MSSIVQILGAAMERLRTSIYSLMGLFALLVAQLTNGYITITLPMRRAQRGAMASREQMSGDALLGDQLLRQQTCAHVAAPLDFTSRVMARVATESFAPEVALASFAAYEAAPEERPLLHQASAVFATLSASALVVLGFSFVATLVNPSLGLTVIGGLVNVGVMALSALRVAETAFSDVATNPGLTTAVMTLLLGGVLFGWAQVSRLYTRTAEEA